MAIKTSMEQLEAAVGRILKDYGDEIDQSVGEVTTRLARSGAAALRTASANTFGGSGRYAKGWTATVQKTRTGTSAVVHNAETPGLPHLLENGHANRGGGRTPGRPHIAPIEAELVAAFEREVVGKLDS